MDSVKKSAAIESLLIEAYGIVQGIGFRPFVYNLAVYHKLTGYVRNTGKGVEIAAQGKKQNLKKFLSDLRKAGFKASYSVRKKNPQRYRAFTIAKSAGTEIAADFPQDLALCGECKKELFSRKDRRFEYPFINCVKCGPRFTIIKKLPYDRKNTTMSKFKMCPDCRSEYEEPKDRRFHAQPNACHKCGPQLFLYDGKQNRVSEKEKAVRDAVSLLKKGKILAVKSIGGYHLCCDASNIKAVKELRKRKKRPYKPFAVIADAASAGKICFINEFEEKELLSPAAPIVILRKKIRDEMTEILSPGNSTLGIMAPYAPLHHLLIKEIPFIAATSGNKSDEPISINEDEAFLNLKDAADFFLAHNRKIENGADDSIVRFLPGRDEKIIIRRSRGYVPLPVKTQIKREMFAAGGDLKNNFCFVRNGRAYLSQYAGDLSESANFEFYGKNIAKMKKFLGVNPAKAVCDAHPGYFSSQYAAKFFKDTEYVQHHYAHMASVMAENNIKGKAFGCIFDGNGYGEDGNIWGGEFIVYCAGNFKRVKHFDYFALPGGDICTKETWRLAVSLLYKYKLLGDIPSHLKKFKCKPIIKMMDNNINSPLSSSVGRLFDAVSSLSGLKNTATFEAEAASALESAADGYETGESYDFEISGEIVDLRGLIKGAVSDVKNGVSSGIISAKFHNTLADIITACAIESGIKNIIFAGGVFQNIRLFDIAANRLLSCGFNIYYNKQVPLNDGGICLGQAYMNNLLLKNK